MIKLNWRIDQSRLDRLFEPSSEIDRVFRVPVVARRLRTPGNSRDVHPEEWTYVRSAAPRRQVDFVNGRICAAECLRMLGAPDGPIGIGPRGMPLWPPRITGSISHCDGYCAAVATWQGTVRSVGIDVEERSRLQTNLEHLVLTNTEQAFLDTRSGEERADLATLLFSAKEAFYKAQFPLTRTFLDFTDVKISVSADRFSVRLERSVPVLGPAGQSFAGRLALTDRHVITAVQL